MEARFERCGLSRIWPNYDDFARATQWHQYQALKYQIEAMRREPAISGYVITELSDIYWESNGLLDFDRNPKVYHDRLRQFNARGRDPGPARIAMPPGPGDLGRGQGVSPACTAGGAKPAPGFPGSWKGVQQAGVWNLPPAPRGSTGMAGKIMLTLPDAVAPRQVQLQTMLFDPDGAEITRNDLEIMVYPRSAPAWRRRSGWSPCWKMNRSRSTATSARPVRPARPRVLKGLAGGPAGASRVLHHRTSFSRRCASR